MAKEEKVKELYSYQLLVEDWDYLNTMENVLDVMENDLFPALEKAQGLQDDIGDIDDDGSESQQKRFEELKHRAETVDKKFRKFGFWF